MSPAPPAKHTQCLINVRVCPNLRLGYFIVIASYGEYSENLATEPNMVRKSSDNNKPEVNAMPMRNGVRSETSHADYELLSHQTVLRRIIWERFAGRITPPDRKNRHEFLQTIAAWLPVAKAEV